MSSCPLPCGLILRPSALNPPPSRPFLCSAWFYIFDTIQKEREVLEGRAEAAGAMELQGRASGAGGVGGGAGQQGGVGHVAAPGDIDVLLEQGAISHLPVVYGGVIGE